MLNDRTFQALSQVEDLDQLDSELQALQESIEKQLASIACEEQSDVKGIEPCIKDEKQDHKEELGQRIVLEIPSLINSNPESGLRKLLDITAEAPGLTKQIHSVRDNFFSSHGRQNPSNGQKNKSKQDELASAPDLLSKIQVASRYLIKSALRKLSAANRQNIDATGASYEGTFGLLTELFGLNQALRILIDHRSTLLKIQVNRMADELEAQSEAPLMAPNKKQDQIDDNESSCSVVVTLEDVQIDPSLLMEQTMQILHSESAKDIQVFQKIIQVAKANQGESGHDEVPVTETIIIQQQDYLRYVYEPILIRQLSQVHAKAMTSEFSGAISTQRDRLLNFRNLQNLLSLIGKLVEIGAIALDTETTVSSLSGVHPQNGDEQVTSTVSKMITDLERTYLSRLINSFLQSESQRMFEFLEARTQKVFEQLNQRHVVQEGTIGEVLEQEAKMVTKMGVVQEVPALPVQDLSKTQAEGQQQLQIIENSSSQHNHIGVVTGNDEEEMYLGSEGVDGNMIRDNKQLLLPADPSLQLLHKRQKSQNRRNQNYAKDAEEDAAGGNRQNVKSYAPSPRMPLQQDSKRPPRPSAAASRQSSGVAASQGIRFGKNNKVVPLVMKSVQNAPQSLRDSQQLAMGTLKLVPSEQRIGDKTRETVEKNQSGSLIRLGKQTTEIDINFAASMNSEAVYGAVNLEKQLFAQRKTIQEERLRIRASQQSQLSNQSMSQQSRKANGQSPDAPGNLPQHRMINRAGGPYQRRDIKSPEYHLQLLRANQAESNASSSQQGPPQPAGKKKSGASKQPLSRQLKDVDFDFRVVLPQHNDSQNPVTGKINQGLHDFYKLVADPLCAQLVKGLHTVSLTVADSFLQSVKTITIQICNNLLVTIQRRPPLPEDKYHGMFAELSQANKACTFSLAALSDVQICTLLNELLFTRAKTEEYYGQLSERLSKVHERHQLRKPVAELQMKTLQGIATLREGFTAHIISRLETTCFASLLAQNWSYHKESFTSTSWIGTSKQEQVVSPFENSKYLRYMVPREDKKRLVLSPSRGLTAWRLQLISLKRDLSRQLAPFSQPNLVVSSGAPRNTLATHIFNRTLAQSSVSILSKLLVICPSRARYRQYTLDMAYFNWCMQNHIELATLELLISLMTTMDSSNTGPTTGARVEEEGIKDDSTKLGPSITKESLDLATSILTLHLVHQTTQSALMLLCADTSADASNNQIKELLSACLSRKAQIPNLHLLADQEADFHKLIMADEAQLSSSNNNNRFSFKSSSIMTSQQQQLIASQTQSSQTRQDAANKPAIYLSTTQQQSLKNGAGHQTGSAVISSVQMVDDKKQALKQAPMLKKNYDKHGSDVVVNGSTIDQLYDTSNRSNLQSSHRALLDSVERFFERATSSGAGSVVVNSASIAELSTEAFFGTYMAAIAPEQRNLFGTTSTSSAIGNNRTLNQHHQQQRLSQNSNNQLRGSFMNPMVDEDLHLNNNNDSNQHVQSGSLPPIGPGPSYKNTMNEVTPGANDADDFPDNAVVAAARQDEWQDRRVQTVVGSAEVLLKKKRGSQQHEDTMEEQQTSVAGVTPGRFDFDTVDVHQDPKQQILEAQTRTIKSGAAGQEKKLASDQIGEGRVVTPGEGRPMFQQQQQQQDEQGIQSAYSDQKKMGKLRAVSEELKERLREQYSQIQEGFFDLKPGQVIQEFRIAVEDCSSAPFAMEPFLRLRGSLRDFSYPMMPAKLILTFLAKRFDLSQSETAHPPLTEDQAKVRAQLMANVASFKENSGITGDPEIRNPHDLSQYQLSQL